MVVEVWKAIRGYEGLYEVSNLGRVRRLFAGGRDGWRVLKPGLNKTGMGYYQVSLSKNGQVRRNVLVHHLVAEAFLGPRPPGKIILHRNGRSLDCAETNLRYGTHQENMQDRVAHGTSNRGERHGNAKLSDEDAARIKQRYVKGAGPALAAEYGVSKQTITRIVQGKTWGHVTEEGEILQ